MYRINNKLITSINIDQEYNTWLSNSMPKTGYNFKRKIDGLNMGQVIYLGKDWSLVHLQQDITPRIDLLECYEEVTQ